MLLVGLGHAQTGAVPPRIRVGLIENEKSVRFRVTDDAEVDGRSDSFRDHPWQVAVLNSKPASFVYRLAVGTCKDSSKAGDIIRFAARQGLSAELSSHLIEPPFEFEFAHPKVYKVLLTPVFMNEEDARRSQLQLQARMNSEIVRLPTNLASGTLQFTNLVTNEHFQVDRKFRVAAATIEISDMEVGVGYHWESGQSRQYGGILEFMVDADGLLSVVNELPLEDYIKGVVPAEMAPGFPYEALKAQAIAARSEAVSKTGLRHFGAPFDLCNDVHCQVYAGLSKRTLHTDMAVQSTAGIFIIYGDQIAEVYYSAVCGGHTEHIENVWLVDAEPFLRGQVDADASVFSSLKNEETLRSWIRVQPPVYCNTLAEDVPPALHYTRKYFRWQVDYTRAELERIIVDRTGKSFGKLQDLRVLRRGVSGRVITVQVVGSENRFILDRELQIRQSLSDNTLYSSCFFIARSAWSNGIPGKFRLRGAGWGHGVGMCQAGAAMMAHAGRKFEQLLTHYYRGVYLKKLY
jgi:SpoIID/LytB domain protein